jgi:PhzF family phenazine biosynthesis protein
VVVLDGFLDDALLQAVAAENNLSETAFVVPSEGRYRLRWFTPTVEVPLCGHATLAAGAVVVERLEPGRDSVVFDTASGPLTVDREGTAYPMELPARTVRAVPLPPALSAALGVTPVETAIDTGTTTSPCSPGPTTSGPSNRTSPQSPVWTGPGSW